MRGNLFFISVAGFCLGVAIRTLYVLPAVCVLPCVIVAIFFGGWWTIERKAYQLACSVFMLCSIVGGVRAAFVQTQIPKEFAQYLNTKVSFEGIVVSPPDIREKNIRLTVEVKEKNKEGEEGNVGTRIIAVVPFDAKVLLGNDIQISGTLQAPEPFATDGGRTFAYDSFLAKDGVFALMPNAAIKVLKPPGYQFWIWGFLVSLNTATQQVMRHAIPSPYSGLSIGILLGGKQGLGDELLTAFTIAGLLQIVVLSGYNVTIVADAILTISKNLPKGVAFLLAAMGVCAFVAAAGGGSSAMRAAIMSLFALIARATNRTYVVLRALCMALVIMIIYNPLLLVYDPGFQLSFLATLGLVLGSPILEVRMLWIRNSTIRTLLATTLAAQIAVLPILLYQSGNLSLVAIPANILTSPIVPFAMGFSALAALGSFIMPAFAPYIATPAYICLWWIVTIAKVSAAVPYANVIISKFSFLVVVLSYTVLGILVWHLRKVEDRRNGIIKAAL